MVSLPRKMLETIIIATAELQAIYALEEIHTNYVDDLQELMEEAIKCLRN
jgi:NADH:ubiquinone oxidoreductase subunit F (NADH-binding)